MSVRDYMAGWDHSKIGTASIVFSVGGVGTASVTGKRSHVTLTSIAEIFSYYSTFASALQTAVLALGTPLPGGTVTFNATNLTYTIASSGNFTMAFTGTAGTLAAAILGFDPAGSYSGASSYVSTRRPRYILRAVVGGQSNVSDEYEPDGLASVGVSMGGYTYAIDRYVAPILTDWEQAMEAKAAPGTVSAVGSAVFTRDATTTVPWTWQHFFDHCSCIEPFALKDDSATAASVHKLRDDGRTFKPTRVTSDLDTLWTIPVRARLLGRIP